MYSFKTEEAKKKKTEEAEVLIYRKILTVY